MGRGGAGGPQYATQQRCSGGVFSTLKGCSSRGLGMLVQAPALLRMSPSGNLTAKFHPGLHLVGRAAAEGAVKLRVIESCC
jgi:hypothetical protein